MNLIILTISISFSSLVIAISIYSMYKTRKNHYEEYLRRKRNGKN